jgi:hypothetical protein
MSHLAPCPACNRHVAVVETTCPFCAATLRESFRGQPRPTPPPRRLSRAAMMAAGATLIGACSANDAISSIKDAATDRPVATDGTMVVPIYGAPFSGTGGSSGTGGVSGITGTGGSVDAGEDGPGDAAPARDAAHDAAKDRSVIAIYGAAFAPGSTGEKPQG